METIDSKNRHLLEVSETILSELESGDVPLEKIISKCKKLARLRNDSLALKWFSLELHGYNVNNLPLDCTAFDASDIALNRAGRGILSEDPNTKLKQQKYWAASVPELEAQVLANLINLQNLTLPTNYTPAITKAGDGGLLSGATFVAETFSTVLVAVQNQKNILTKSISLNKSILARVSNNLHTYVLNINMQVRFESITDSIFQETKIIVDKKLAEICPNMFRMFLACYERMQSENPEDWSQAMSSCRNILKEFANYVYKPQETPYEKRNNEKLDVTEDKYKNRILAFIDMETRSEKNRFLSSRTGDLISRLNSLNDLLSRGAKNEIQKLDVNMCVLDTYMLLGSIVGYVPKKN